MRLFFAAAATALLTAAAPIDHSATMTATAEGGIRMGNPAAKVRIVEWASLTCPHCRDFHIASAPRLKALVAGGRVSYEVRNLVLNGPDLAAVTLARCQGPKAYFRTIDVFFRKQGEWTRPFTTIADAEQARIAALPEDQQLAAVARAGKLDGFAAAHGMDAATFDRCLADKAQAAQIDALIARASKDGVQGTPTFFINGKRVSVNTWAGIEPLVRTALASK